MIYIHNAENTASWLIIAILISILFSPPLVGITEVLLALILLTSNTVQKHIINAWHQPMFKAALGFYILICIGVIYSAYPFSIALHSWASWRQLLLLPLTLAFFNNITWKYRVTLIFIIVAIILAITSFITWFTEYNLPIYWSNPGVLVRNRITQGMIFSVAAFSAIILASQNLHRLTQLILINCSIILITNVIFITPGRSGYLTLLIFIFIRVTNYLRQKLWSWPQAINLASLTVGFLIIILMFAQISKQRLTEGWEEALYYQQATKETSIGIRIIYWQNTLSLLNKRPLFGYGTGAFGTAYTQHVAGKSGMEGVPATDPYNQYMRIWIEYGVFGLIIFLALLGSAVLQHSITSRYRILGLGVMIDWCITSLANSHFTTFAEGSFIYLWLGIMLASELKLTTA